MTGTSASWSAAATAATAKSRPTRRNRKYLRPAVLACARARVRVHACVVHRNPSPNRKAKRACLALPSAPRDPAAAAAVDRRGAPLSLFTSARLCPVRARRIAPYRSWWCKNARAHSPLLSSIYRPCPSLLSLVSSSLARSFPL